MCLEMKVLASSLFMHQTLLNDCILSKNNLRYISFTLVSQLTDVSTKKKQFRISNLDLLSRELCDNHQVTTVVSIVSYNTTLGE